MAACSEFMHGNLKAKQAEEELRFSMARIVEITVPPDQTENLVAELKTTQD